MMCSQRGYRLVVENKSKLKPAVNSEADSSKLDEIPHNDSKLANKDGSSKTVVVSANFARFIHKTLDLVIPKNFGCQQRVVSIKQILAVIDFLAESSDITGRDPNLVSGTWCVGKFETPDDLFIELTGRRCKNINGFRQFINYFD